MNLFLFLFLCRISSDTFVTATKSICRNPVIAIKYGRHCRVHEPPKISDKFTLETQLLRMLFGIGINWDYKVCNLQTLVALNSFEPIKATIKKLYGTRVLVLDKLDKNLIESQQKHVYHGKNDEKFGHKTSNTKESFYFIRKLWVIIYDS